LVIAGTLWGSQAETGAVMGYWPGEELATICTVGARSKAKAAWLAPEARVFV